MKEKEYNYMLFRAIIILGGILTYLSPSAAAEKSSWLDSATARYAAAAADYDSISLMNAAALITRQPEADRQSPQALLVLGLIYWRLELVAYCLDDQARTGRYGEQALTTLDQAEKAGSDIYLTAGHKALASQLMAGLGITKAAIYGPRSAKELKKAAAANPQGYYTLLATATQAGQAPSFAGGDPEKAVVLLKKMAVTFPDSIDVTIHLADACRQVGRKKEARQLIGPVVKDHPANLLAKKVSGKLPRQ